MAEDQQEMLVDGDISKDPIVLAVQRFYPSEDEEPDEVDKTAPQLSAQMILEKGKKYQVVGPVQWWLYVKCLDTEEYGYVPSTHVVPLKKDLSIQDQKDIDNGAEISPSMVERQDINMKFFPAAPVERDMLNRKPCPEESANIFSKITFWWLTQLIYRGFKRHLVDEDLWSLAERNRSSNIVPIISSKWQHLQDEYKKKHQQKPVSEIDNIEEPNHIPKDIQVNGQEDKDQETVQFVPKKTRKKPNNKRPSLAKALFLMFWRKFLSAVFFKLLHDVALFIQPLMLELLIVYTEEKSDKWKGYAYCATIFGVAVLQSFALHQYFHIMITLGMNIRTSIIGMVYPKALRLNNESRKTSTAGEMVNLMTTDAQRLMELMNYLNTLWSGPFQITVALYFLYNTMGVSILAGVGVMLLLIPLNLLVTRIVKKLQIKTMTSKDKRLKLINEILNGIKVLKLYAWETSYLQKVLEIRKDELKHQKKSMYVNAGFSFTYTCAPFLVSLATFTIYVLTGNILTAEKAFVAIALFNILRFPLVMFPNMILNFIQARVSIQRLQDFLNLEELDPDNVSKTMPGNFSNQAIHVENCTVKWDKKDGPILDDINLNITTGSLVAVVGQVGSGKSTLLSALLGETEKTKGQVYLQGSVAYVPQQAWIQNATLRDNILFGRTFDRERYRSTIKACALQTDLDLLPSGDMTEIGEKGINLSGGQKQRVNLARAVYFNTDVYLFDDPLSAVDSHVGKHLFDNVIGPRGKLRKKTRVLVTHAVHFLPQVDQIIVLQNGRISEVGTYDELQANQGAFAEFLKTYVNEKQDEPEEDTHHREPSHIHHKDIHEPEERNLLTVTDMDHMFGSTSELNAIVKSSSRLNLAETVSAHSDIGTILSEDKTVQRVIQEETSEVGRVRFSVFYTYAKATGLFLCFLFFLFLLASEASIVGSKIWLARWSSDNVTTDSQRDRYLLVYGALGLSQAFCMLFSSLFLAYGANVASNVLHDRLMINIMHSPMSFFESTPQGRIVNRFSKDMYVIDETVPTSLMSFWKCFFGVMSAFFAISYATPIFLSVVFPLMVLYVFIQRLYVSTSRQLRRIESVSRSPIYSNFLETINGTSTIRAYSQQQHFIRENYYRVDENQVAYYPWISSNRWLAIRLEFIGNLVIFFASLFAVVYRDSIESGLVGLSLTHAFQITQTLNWMVRMSGELETNIVAVERVKEYSETPREAAWIVEDHRPPDDWPGSGHIAIESFDLRYRDNLPLVLKNINCDIAPGEKIGLVGRTGAGKSSLSLALFRILESAGGRITIDDIDISKIGLQDLRSRLTIIPQDPVLFSGTLRFNLDPFDKYSDEELWKVLEVSHLKQFVSGLAEGLQHPVAEGGENLSVGQRQLVCLARALLRKSKVLVLDEATAAVDLETDELIQNTIRTEFADRTVLTIAHRLNTIMDYSRILVLDKGFTVEFDTPSTLLSQKRMFYNMVKDAGLA